MKEVRGKHDSFSNGLIWESLPACAILPVQASLVLHFCGMQKSGKHFAAVFLEKKKKPDRGGATGLYTALN